MQVIQTDHGQIGGCGSQLIAMHRPMIRTIPGPELQKWYAAGDSAFKTDKIAVKEVNDGLS